MPLTWRDTDALARALVADHPEIDPLTLTFQDVRRYVAGLPGFNDDPDAASDQDIEDVQAAWYDVFQE
jgi:FeS assembly protein IscX